MTDRNELGYWAGSTMRSREMRPSLKDVSNSEASKQNIVRRYSSEASVAEVARLVETEIEAMRQYVVECGEGALPVEEPWKHYQLKSMLGEGREGGDRAP